MTLSFFLPLRQRIQGGCWVTAKAPPLLRQSQSQSNSSSWDSRSAMEDEDLLADQSLLQEFQAESDAYTATIDTATRAMEVRKPLLASHPSLISVSTLTHCNTL